MTEREELLESISCAREIAARVYELDIPMSKKTPYLKRVDDLDREFLDLNRRMEQEG